MRNVKIALKNVESQGKLTDTKESLMITAQEDTDQESVPNRVEGCRIALNMSRIQLANKADIDASYVYLIEKGKRNPTVKVAKRIAKALNRSLEELFPN